MFATLAISSTYVSHVIVRGMGPGVPSSRHFIVPGGTSLSCVEILHQVVLNVCIDI